jgi:alpha-galactosidase
MPEMHAARFTNDGHEGFCYRTGLTAVSDMLIEGQLVTCGMMGNGLAHDVLTHPQNAGPAWFDPKSYNWPYAFRLEVGGQLLHSGWELEAFEQDGNGDKLFARLKLRNQYTPAMVTVCTELDGTGFVARNLIIENTGHQSLAIGRVSVMSGGLERLLGGFFQQAQKETPYQAGYMHSPHWGNEGDFQWHDLALGSFRITSSYPESEHRQPMVVIRNTETGSHFMIQVGWSGGSQITMDVAQNVKRYIDHDHSAPRFVGLSFEAGPHAPAPIRVVEPGESYGTPTVHVGVANGSLDELVNDNYRHVRSRIGTIPEARQLYVEAYLHPFYMDDEMVDHTLEESAAIGVDVFFIDAGWYAPPEANADWYMRAGDWEDVRFERSLLQIREKTHKMGMKFGLWMEPERVGPEARRGARRPGRR